MCFYVCSQEGSPFNLKLYFILSDYLDYLFLSFLGIFKVYIYVYICIYIYTGCPRRNVPDFGRVFLMLNYTDITQNTYIQS